MQLFEVCLVEYKTTWRLYEVCVCVYFSEFIAITNEQLETDM
jgi:hypothetical protein